MKLVGSKASTEGGLSQSYSNLMLSTIDYYKKFTNFNLLHS